MMTLPTVSSEELVKEVCIRCMGRFRIARLDPDPGYRIAKSAEELPHGYMWAVSTILGKNELPADTQAPAWGRANPVTNSGAHGDIFERIFATAARKSETRGDADLAEKRPMLHESAS
jgi:hypothetical protein